MKDVIIFDNEIKNLEKNNFNLSLLFFKNGISFSLYSITNKKYHNLIFKNCPSDIPLDKFINETISQTNLLSENFNKIIVQVATNRTTIIPESFFDEKTFIDFFYFNYPKDTNNSVKYYLIKNEKIYVLYDLNKNIENYLNNNFINYELVPHAATYIYTNLKDTIIQEDENSEKVFVQICKEFIDILFIKNKTLTYYNTFLYNSTNDILYYILNVYQQLKINQEESQLTISGFIEKDNSLILSLKKFIKFVEFDKLSHYFNYFYKFSDIQGHYFNNFLNLNR